MKYPLVRPLLGDEERRAIDEVLASGHLVQGPKVRRFEREVAQIAGLAHGVACSSGTAALHLALAAIDIAPTREVLVPAFGFPATANAVELAGGRVRFVDVDPQTLCPTLQTLEEATSEATQGLLAVHPFGLPAPTDAYGAFCKSHSLWFLQDAACALGTDPDTGWADKRFPTCLSFHPRKTITTAEGGMVLTDDEELARKMRQLRNHGIEAEAPGWLRFESAGFNYRLSDLAAALGLAQLGRLDEIVGKRRQLALWYREHLHAADHVEWLKAFDRDGLSIQSMIIRLPDEFDRDIVIREMLKEGVQTTLAGYAIDEQPFYQRRYGQDGRAYPHSSRLFRQGLTLPLAHDMEEPDVEAVAKALARATDQARR